MVSLDPNKHYPTTTESEVIIRFQDCDPMQHLYNGRYFDYFFNAREDQIARLYEGFSPAMPYKEYQCGWVIYEHQIAYLRSALVGEWVKIMSRLVYVASDTIVVEYFMTDQAKKSLKTVLWSTMKYVDVRTGQRVAHQPELQTFLETILHKDLDFTAGFNARIKEIKAELKPLLKTT